MEEPSDQENLPTKLCSQCALPIPMAAKLCHECKSYQRGLLSGLPISQTVLSLLVALIAVIGPAITSVRSALHKPHSELSTGGATLNQSAFVVVVSNAGDAPALIRDGTMFVNGQIFGALDVENLESSVVKPGINLVRFRFSFNNNGATQASLLSGVRENATAAITAVESDGMEKKLSVPVDFYQFADTRISFAARCEQASQSGVPQVGCGARQQAEAPPSKGK